MPVPAERTSWWPATTSTPTARLRAARWPPTRSVACRWRALHTALRHLQTPFRFSATWARQATTRCKSRRRPRRPKYGLYALFATPILIPMTTGYPTAWVPLLSAPYFPLPNWQNLDWGLSQINLNNSFTGSVIYDLPFGRGKQFGSDWNERDQHPPRQFPGDSDRKNLLGISCSLDRQQ